MFCAWNHAIPGDGRRQVPKLQDALDRWKLRDVFEGQEQGLCRGLVEIYGHYRERHEMDGTGFTSDRSEVPGLDVFAGIQNYPDLCDDDVFWAAVRNTFIWSFISPFFGVGTGLLLV